MDFYNSINLDFINKNKFLCLLSQKKFNSNEKINNLFNLLDTMIYNLHLHHCNSLKY